MTKSFVVSLICVWTELRAVHMGIKRVFLRHALRKARYEWRVTLIERSTYVLSQVSRDLFHLRLPLSSSTHPPSATHASCSSGDFLQ